MSKFKPAKSQKHIDAIAAGPSLIHRLDARVAILISLSFSIVVALSNRLPVLVAGLALAVVSALVARLSLARLARKLLPVNAFMLLLFAVLPFSVPGTALFHVGPLPWSREGCLFAAAITLKSNAIVLVLAVFLGTMEMVRLGHALVHLHVPPKLAHLFLFTVRYMEVLQQEYRRLANAMKVRCFRPRFDVHTCRTLGSLVGMLLVKSLDRSERIVAAMKCRGFNGQFPILCHFRLTRTDVWFGVLSLVAILGLGCAEWVWRIPS